MNLHCFVDCLGSALALGFILPRLGLLGFSFANSSRMFSSVSLSNLAATLSLLILKISLCFQASYSTSSSSFPLKSSSTKILSSTESLL
ncbi:hypothetical protein AQUCO_00100339v1 [Aquilegia coerulea]|uniref:Uncharacterized protein n=1 Tax=Aquilegia coerulea TaxID=218851 RepID=A0A2G5FA32_AQUCA|nr:hypothetical protein AQUCO_00100339v1 [Aquilegia coerulea]